MDVFHYTRIESTADLPPLDARIVDVAVLDMNHAWPNLGHDSIIQAIREIACDLIPVLEGTELRVRALSYEVREKHMVPETAGGRFAVYVGTGGPGHIDPHENDGVSPGTQGISEDPAWEGPLFRVFDTIRENRDAALISVCHSFGVMCRWSGVARPVLRPDGKSAGILENLLTPEAARHPWFGRFAEQLPERRRLRVVDHRLYDLLPETDPPDGGVMPIGYETLGVGGPRGNAITMIEFERDSVGVMPRLFGVNHHPEIVDRARQRMILEQKRDRGEVTADWFEERDLVLTKTYPNEDSEGRLRLTSEYTFVGPLRFYIHREVRKRSEALGLGLDIHEDRVLTSLGGVGAGSPAR